MRHTCGRTTGGVRDGGAVGTTGSGGRLGACGTLGAGGWFAAAVSRTRRGDFTPPRHAASPMHAATAAEAILRTPPTVAGHPVV